MKTSDAPGAKGGPAPAEDRREVDRALRRWQAGEADGVALDGPLPAEWPHCFVVALGDPIERSRLLAYGNAFARAFGLSLETRRPRHVVQQLPSTIARLILAGCDEARRQGGPVRREGRIERENGTGELYRAAFIPLGRQDGAAPRILGSFNSRPAAPAAAAAAGPPQFWRRLRERVFGTPQ